MKGTLARCLQGIGVVVMVGTALANWLFPIPSPLALGLLAAGALLVLAASWLRLRAKKDQQEQP